MNNFEYNSTNYMQTHTHRNVDNHRVKLSVWDTAGQERFKSMAPMYYRKSNAAFLVYDITDSKTFDDIKIWAEGEESFTISVCIFTDAVMLMKES